VYILVIGGYVYNYGWCWLGEGGRGGMLQVVEDERVWLNHTVGEDPRSPVRP